MKITFIINSLLNKSGTERVTCHLANLFVEQLGYDVSIFNRTTDSTNTAYYLNNKVQVINTNGNYLNFVRKIQQHINKDKPNIILIHNMGRLSLICSLLKKQTAKFISLEHVAFNTRPVWIKLLSKIFYKKIDKVITLTHKDELNYKIWFPNVTTIYNISPFTISKHLKLNRNKEIIAIGRLTYQKNFQALLQAWEKIQHKADNWSLKIYGTGQDFDKLNHLIEKNKLHNVELMGQIDKVENIYKNAALFVMSSRFEGLPMVLIEAQTFGLPIISFDCPHGPAEIINNNKNGILVKNQDIDELANAMLTLMLNDKQRQLYSYQAIEDARKFQEETILKNWKNLFEEK